MTASSGGVGSGSVNYTIAYANQDSIGIQAGGQAIPDIPLDDDGNLDLNKLVTVLSEQTGISEEAIVKNHLPGIVSALEESGKVKLKNKEILDKFNTDGMDDPAPTSGTKAPGGVTDGASEDTKKILLIFNENGIYINPQLAPNPELSKNLRNDLNTAIDRQYQTDGFTSKLANYMQSFPNGDVMASLFYVFQESIEQTNEDKRYFLSKLSDMNKVSQAMSTYLKELEGKSQELETETVKDMETKGKKYQAGSTTIDVSKASISMDLDENGEAIRIDSAAVPMNNTALASAIKQLETDMETVRNKREEFQTMFENFDQKANQLFNMLSTVLKNVKEMQSGITRNLL